MVEIDLVGMDAILAKIQEMGRAAKSVEDKAITEAGKVILSQAKSNLNSQLKKRTGNLEDSLDITNPKGRSGNRYVLVGLEKDDTSNGFYGKFFEWGASAHIIKIKRGKNGGRIMMHHPGTSPRPFLGPAYTSKVKEAREVMKRELQKGLGL